MPQPALVRQYAEELISTHRSAWLNIIEEQRRVLGMRPGARRRRLGELEGRIGRLLDEVDAATRRWIAETYPLIYRQGARDGAAQAASSFTEWTQLHVRAVNGLAADTFGDLLTATQFIRDDTKRFIREAGRLASQLTVSTERTAVQGGRLLERILDDGGIKAIIYRDGSRHGLAEYSQMLVRTKSAIAYNYGSLNAGRQAGILFYEVFDGPDCGWTRHADNDQAMGKIVTYEESLTWPISHPQCRRSFGARPDVTSATQAAGAPRSATEAQTFDIRQNDARRAASQRRATNRRQRQRRRQRREATT